MDLSLMEIAKYSGTSYATVRRMKIQLGRIPTIEEAIQRKRKVGRPTTYEANRASKQYILTAIDKLVAKYGENATLKEIIENERNN